MTYTEELMIKEFAPQLAMALTPLPDNKEQIIQAVLIVLEPYLFEGWLAMNAPANMEASF